MPRRKLGPTKGVPPLSGRCNLRRSNSALGQLLLRLVRQPSRGGNAFAANCARRVLAGDENFSDESIIGKNSQEQ